jgi:hypothetical protein
MGAQVLKRCDPSGFITSGVPKRKTCSEVLKGGNKSNALKYNNVCVFDTLVKDKRLKLKPQFA